MQHKTYFQVIKLISLVLATLYILGGCSKQSSSTERNTTPVELSSQEQILADSIWNARKLWKGCQDLAIYKRGDHYYLAVNVIVSKSNYPVSGFGIVTNCKYEVYYINEHKVGSHVTLADAAVTTTGTCLAKIYPKETDTADVQKALISQLVSKAI